MRNYLRLIRELHTLMYDSRSAQWSIAMKMETIMADINSLRVAVQAQTAVVTGVVTLLTDLHSRLQKALEDEDLEAIEEIAADISKNTNALAEAVSANTPGGPTVTSVEPPPPATPPEGSSS